MTISIGSTPAQAEVRVPGIFSDHMVLQRDKPVRVWGWADANEPIAVQLGETTSSTQADNAGRWQVELPEMAANSKPQSLLIRGTNMIEIKDVLIGEVWLCSGQSNMEWTVARSADAQSEIAAGDYPMIRHIKIARTPEFLPVDDTDADWQIGSPQTVGNFTACGYFMARHLHEELGVPIGLVNSSWGGTRVEPWTPPVGFEQVDALQDIYQSVIGRRPGTDAYNENLSQHLEATQQWISEAKLAQENESLITPNPVFPPELVPFKSHQDPTMLFNGMIHPILGYTIRGAIWYQGESNHSEGMLYFEKKKALIGGWRELWAQGEFPFYYVQIAPFQYGSEDPTILPRFWEAQAAVQQVPNTGMVVINDIATINNIHPPAKQEVGRRLARLALKNDYGQTDLVANSPQFESLETVGDRLKVTFRNTGGGLKTRDGQPPSHFEIIGSGSAGFQKATAVIDGDQIILHSAEVKSPTAFRFAWHKTAEPNLVGGPGLPVGAVRGGKVPAFVDNLPIGEEHQLVYDLDLSKLGEKIQYDVDNSDDIKAYDRIAYLLELTPTNGDTQVMYVSMNAFTDNVKQIGIPTTASKASFQQPVEALDIYTNVSDIVSGTNIPAGHIEFWPNNYGPDNAARVEGAVDTLYDCGDAPAEPVNGYGSMQVHHCQAKQTLFAINKWNAGPNADLGIGNSTGKTKDWTFTGNGSTYSKKRLRVYVRTK